MGTKIYPKICIWTSILLILSLFEDILRIFVFLYHVSNKKKDSR